MEKSTERTRFTKFTRLLVSILVLFLCSSDLFAHYYSRYIFRPLEDYVFENQETTFEVVIPNLKPADILVTAQNLPDKVTFISSETTEILNENGDRCTRVRVTYRFEDVGYFKMTPIASRIRYGAYNLTVQNVTVLHNPQTIQPVVNFKVIDETKSSFSVGEKIPLQLTVSFASRIESFKVNIMEDSAMCKTKDEFLLPVTIENFSDIAYPIATFYFIPLKAGKIQVPQVEVKVRTWKGADKIAVSQPLTFNIQNGSVTEKKAQIKNIKIYTEISNLAKNQLSAEEIEQRNEKIKTIAELRTKEKNIPFLFSVQKQRKALETEIGLENTKNEFSYIVLYIILLLFLFSIVSLIVMIFYHKKSGIVVCSILIFLIGVCILICVLYLNKDYALLLNEKIYSVPEETSNVCFSITPGTKVEVKGITNEWIFVNYGGTSCGWIKNENLIFLR